MSMQPPRLRPTVLSLMVLTAILAVSWSMCLGIGHLTIYGVNVKGEKRWRDEAHEWEARQELEKAANSRRSAGEWAQRNSRSLAHITTALGLIGAGVVFGGLGLSVRTHCGTRYRTLPRWVHALSDIGIGLGAIVSVGLFLGFVAYIGIMVFVVATSE